jgi:hypothetical protein
MTNKPPDLPNYRCPPWCVMHIDGRHVGELELAGTVSGFNIYTRPVDYGDSQVGLQVIVVKPNGEEITQIAIDPGAVTEAAWLSELRQSLAVIEGDTADGEDGQ